MCDVPVCVVGVTVCDVPVCVVGVTVFDVPACVVDEQCVMYLRVLWA